MKGYDTRFGKEPKEHHAAMDDGLKAIIIGLAVLAVILALI